MKYKTLVADPPWSFKNKKTGGSMKSGSSAKYPTLTTEEIKTLVIHDTPIQKIGDTDSVLFLWVPVSLIQDGLDVMKEWKYTYKTSIIWIKTNTRPGMGFTFRNKAEICLFGKRGKIPAFKSSKSNVIYALATKHSKKPVEFFELIEPEVEKYNLSPKIELFARDSKDGWYGWGLDYPPI